MIDNSQQSTTYFTHGFHPYPAKFTPQLVNKYLSSYCKRGDFILDPFCGSGTTMVEGAINGINSVGIDLNPIAYIASKAKTNRYEEKDLYLVDKIIDKTRKINSVSTNIEIPNFPNRKHWFQDNVCVELADLKARINVSSM